MSSVIVQSSTIIDSGASKSGTNNVASLHSIEAVNGVCISAAFGETIQPKCSGILRDLNVEALLIPSMTDNLLSVSQVCSGVRDSVPKVGIFTQYGTVFYAVADVEHLLAQIATAGNPLLKGDVQNGVYVLDPFFKAAPRHRSSTYNVGTMLASTVTSASPFDNLHAITNHAGSYALHWHRSNSVNANFTSKDERAYRPLCQGCVLGSSRQMGTDHHKAHRPKPVTPGHHFTMDAYSHHVPSTHGHYYTDIIKDRASGMLYSIFTKDRSADSLIASLTRLFNNHPHWSYVDGITLKTIRLDSEGAYISDKFRTWTASKGFTLEFTPPRDKHAGGIAERSVGLAVLKANEAMMGSTVRCPMPMWPHAIQYAIDTANFNPNSTVADSAYHYETGLPINMHHLHPFFCVGYMFIPLGNVLASLDVLVLSLSIFSGTTTPRRCTPTFLLCLYTRLASTGSPLFPRMSSLTTLSRT